MAEIKELTQDEFNIIVAEHGFAPEMLVKDYYITILLYCIRNVKGIYFKGGTALQKTILNYTRLSEDIDFTLERGLKSVKSEVISLVNGSGRFGDITQDKDVDGFTRLVVPFETNLGKGAVFIDLNERSKLFAKPENQDIKHFYPNIPKFRFACLAEKEMVAEKIAAAIGRNKPRDHYDIYQVIKHKLLIDMKMADEKCRQSNVEPSIIRMFNRAKKLKKRWDADMIPLIAEETSFQEVMKTLAKHFKLKEEKVKLKNNPSKSNIY